MKLIQKRKKFYSKSVSEERRTEDSYQKLLNPFVTLAFCPSFLFFMILSYYRGLYLESFFLFLMLINGLLSVYLGFKLQTMESLIRLKRIGSAIAFSLLAAIFINGLLRIDPNLYIPWIFIYPLPVLLFFGKRLGFLWASIFSVVAAVILVMVDIPPLNPGDVKVFKINATSVLFGILAMALISENIRIRVQNELVAAQKSVAELRDYLGLDSLNYLSLPGLLESTGVADPEQYFCKACFDGCYPVEFDRKVSKDCLERL